MRGPRPAAAPGAHDAGARRAPGAWHAHAPSVPVRPPLDRDLDVDVAIVGAGFSGLWTAYHLLEGDPSLRICILERDVVGFGASGRNGGWLMGAAPADLRAWERRFGLEAVRRAQQVLVDAVDEIAGVIALEELGAQVRLAGSLTLARSPAEVARVQHHRDALVRVGWPADGLRWIEGDEVQARIGAIGTRGALDTRPCGTLDPARLVHGLAARIEARGAVLHEQSGVVAIEPGLVRTAAATVRAPRIVVATEAFTVEQRGQGRRYLPLASTIVSTARSRPTSAPKSAGSRARRSATRTTSSSTHRSRTTAGWRSAVAARRTASGRRSSTPARPTP